MKKKIIAVATNPIQYQVPLWRKFQEDPDVDFRVLYVSDNGLVSHEVPGVGQSWTWNDLDLLAGYQSEFVNSKPLPFLRKPTGHLFPTNLDRQIRGSGCDGVLVHGYVTACSIAAFLAARRARVPVIMRGESHEHFHRSVSRRALKRVVLPTMLKQIQGFVAIGTWNREFWRSYGVPASRIETALYAVDNERFASTVSARKDEIASLRARFTSDGNLALLFCGQLIPRKGLDVLLEAIALVRDRIKCKLIVVGEGPDRAKLEAMGTNLELDVEWLGLKRQSELPLLYAACDILAVPSRFEMWGLVVNEALACGTPCIVSDAVGAGPDLIASTGAGDVFMNGSASALSQSLAAAATRGGVGSWRRQVSSAIARADLRFTVEAVKALLGKTE